MTPSPSVLLVDDNRHLRDLYRMSLESLGGMRVVGEAEDGEQGIARAGELLPDIILLDLSMPTMDGLEALHLIRRASPASHVVVLTGFKRERLEEAAVELGASAFIEKGMPPTQLADALRLATAGPPPRLQELPQDRREALARRASELV